MATIKIHYDHIKKNAMYVKKQATDIIAVVKNNAYNLNLKECIHVFSEAGINYFATTSLKECALIRAELGKDARIFLLNPVYDFSTVKQYAIEITIPNLHFLKQELNHIRDVTLHLEFAGSMRRSGVKTLKEVLEIIQFCKENQLKLKGFWSHFAFADEFNGFYEKEKQLVLDVLKEATKVYNFEVIHLQNSASFLRDGAFPETTHARLGILLYGAMPYDTKRYLPAFENLDILPPITVYGDIIHIVSLDKGECIGYSNSYIADTNKRVGIVNIGYGDGIIRDRLKHNTCIINHKEKQIYSVMMSHLVVEIDEHTRRGDRVFIYNETQQLHDFIHCFGPNSVQLAALNYDSLEVKKIY